MFSLHAKAKLQSWRVTKPLSLESKSSHNRISNLNFIFKQQIFFASSLTCPKMFQDDPIFLCQFVPMIFIYQIQFLFSHKNFRMSTKYDSIFGLVQKIWTCTKLFGTCRRTRHQILSSYPFYYYAVHKELKFSLNMACLVPIIFSPFFMMCILIFYLSFF